MATERLYNTKTENEKGKEKVKEKGKKKQKTDAPDEMPINNEMIEYAVKKGYVADLEDLTEAFLQHHRAEGNQKANWYAAWQRWMRNELEWYPERNVPKGYEKKKDIKPKTYPQLQDAERRGQIKWLKDQKNEKSNHNDADPAKSQLSAPDVK